MSKIDLKNEVGFGLENLNKVYENIIYIAELEAESRLVVPALTYECFGYYNAIEHLILRLTKYLGTSTPSGSFSHKRTLTNFNELVNSLNINADQSSLNTILELMAFRHVATKIYGFLIDEDKLKVIVSRIKDEHTNISQLISQVLEVILVEEGE